MGDIRVSHTLNATHLWYSKGLKGDAEGEETYEKPRWEAEDVKVERDDMTVGELGSVTQTGEVSEDEDG
jgi:hypothetical protein